MSTKDLTTCHGAVVFELLNYCRVRLYLLVDPYYGEHEDKKLYEYLCRKGLLPGGAYTSLASVEERVRNKEMIEQPPNAPCR